MISSVSRFSNTHFASQAVVPTPQPIHFGVKPTEKPKKGRIEIPKFWVPFWVGAYNTYQGAWNFFEKGFNFFTKPLQLVRIK